MKRFTAVIVGAAATAAALLPAAPAQAGSGCVLGECSTTFNQSSASVWVAKDWCWNEGTTGSSKTDDPYCSDSTERRWIAAYTGRTPSGQDWDTFRVDAGFCYQVHFLEHEFWGSEAWDVTYNQVNKGHLWVKVETNAIAFVRSQAYGRCP